MNEKAGTVHRFAYEEFKFLGMLGIFLVIRFMKNCIWSVCCLVFFVYPMRMNAASETLCFVKYSGLIEKSL